MPSLSSHNSLADRETNPAYWEAFPTCVVTYLALQYAGQARHSVGESAKLYAPTFVATQHAAKTKSAFADQFAQRFSLSFLDNLAPLNSLLASLRRRAKSRSKNMRRPRSHPDSLAGLVQPNRIPCPGRSETMASNPLLQHRRNPEELTEIFGRHFQMGVPGEIKEVSCEDVSFL